MSKIDESVTYEGGCHCGAVRFRVIVKKHEATDCNCSICRKKGFIHLIVPPEQFILLKGEKDLTTYTFNTRTAKHTFCGICGIHSFYHPRSHPEWIDVNLRCLDEDVLDRFDIKGFDGSNWEENIHKLTQNE
ncbi:glutathione-dependent formaldehyde-activating GFA [Gloeothece citriformis PCC 7424]|uniref:Glutathione-dependent formaldehyde-activating GFA n=1 Tax=Gloeothece citriformis (strain PCC 7424) TaxID=65393 RepID=B7K8C4_GLOC7|nr:GFA family protein [Gloeothece citriformis]ACK69884.1 glutathione-dependent formaldehyde-activating GFA [Gloeothece citriformis PCC 7424]